MKLTRHKNFGPGFWLYGGLVLGALGIVGCGSSSAPVATAPPPPATTTQPTGLGGSLEDVSPGTPIGQLSNTSDLQQALVKNLQGSGTAVCASQISVDYVSYSGNDFRRQNQGTQEVVQTPSINVMGTFYGGSPTLYFQSVTEGTTVYQFVPQANIFGLQLYSTDVVALFRSSSYLLKVAYRSANPVIQRFRIEPMGWPMPVGNYSGGYSSQVYGQQIHVVQQVLTTNFQYPQYQGTPVSNPYQSQNPYYGGYGSWGGTYDF